MSKKDASLRVSRWAMLMEDYQFSVEHRPGTSMKHADALSRNPVSVCVIQNKQDGLIARIQRAQEEDEKVKKIIQSVKQGNKKNFILRREVLYLEREGDSFLVVPRSMQYDVIRDAHERGHFGWQKTEHLLQQEFWFPDMRRRIQKFISNCVKCLLAERKQGKAEGFLNPIEKGDKPLTTYHVDHLGPMPSTAKSYKHLFAVVDSFTKFLWLYTTKSTTSEEVIGRLKKQAVIFGNPKRIISDRGTAFTSKQFKTYCDEENIEHSLITTGVPRGNGQIERMNRTIIPILTKLSMEKPTEWYKYVDMVQQYINSSFSRSIGMAPFQLLFGVSMKLKNDSELRDIMEKEFVEIFQRERSELRDIALSNIQKIRDENKKTYDRKRKEPTKYKLGDIVAIKRTELGGGLKVIPKFLGPYRVISVLRKDRYLVEKVGDHEGPHRTGTSVDYMKPYPISKEFGYEVTDEEDNSIEDDTMEQDGRVVGL